jgi:hypothetical protein
VARELAATVKATAAEPCGCGVGADDSGLSTSTQHTQKPLVVTK